MLGCEQVGRTDEVTVLGPKPTSQYTRNGQNTFGYRSTQYESVNVGLIERFRTPARSEDSDHIHRKSRGAVCLCLRLPPPWPGQQWFLRCPQWRRW